MKVPGYEELQQAARELIQSFNLNARRYKAGSYTDLRKVVKDLELKYKGNVKSKPKAMFSFSYFTNTEADETRLAQIACITQLEKTFPDNKDKEDLNRNCFAILLGSILYRFLRLMKVYQDYTAVGTSTNNCALITTLREVLRLSEDNGCDALTVFDCCSAYLDYLKQPQIADTYGYIKKNKEDFFKKLNEMIAKHQKDAAIILKRIEYLTVIQTIDGLLVSYDAPIRALFPRLMKELRTALGKKEGLSAEDIAEIWQPFSASLKPHEAALLEKIMIHDTIKKQQLDSPTSGSCEFEKVLGARLTVYKQYVLFGAHVVTLEKFNEMPQQEEQSLVDKMNNAAVTTLRTALTIDAGNLLDDDSRKYGFQYFQHFLNIPGIEEQVTAKSWSGVDILKAYIHTTLSEWQPASPVSQTVKI